jgi:type II secretory pathway component PulF
MSWRTIGDLPEPTSNVAGQRFFSPRALVMLIYCYAVLIVMACVVVRFEKVFRNFKTQLPLSTRITLWFGHALLSPVWTIVLFLPAIALSVIWAAAFPALADPILRRRRRRMMVRLAIVCLGVVVSCVAYSLFAPMLSLINQ